MALVAALLALGGCRPGGETGTLGATAAPVETALVAAPLGRDATPTASFSGRPDRIAEPTVADVMTAGPLGEITLGRSDAPVTLVEYASLTCPHCRAFHQQTWPAFKRAYVDTGKVHYILREFPIGRSSGNAWLVARCAGGERTYRLFEHFLANQSRWVSQEVRLDAIFAVAREVGMTRAEFDACLTDQKTIAAINWVKEHGRRLGVIGTPTFFIGAEQFRTVPTIEELRSRIDPLLAARVAASSG
ncbi:MAG: thioredoxin domain-containing protein [Rhizobiales bacterium]|nr:thioredoxin domain-containing protein [Hyphomicrobiales bacterium]